MAIILLIFLSSVSFGYEKPSSSKPKQVEYKFQNVGEVSFKAVGNPGFLTINGDGASLSGSHKEGKGVFHVKLSDLKTGIDLRDEHMRDKYLEVGKYPEAKLVVKSIVQLPSGKYFWKGDLTLKDTTKPVEGEAYDFGSSIKTSFKIKLTDFKSIGVPSWLGVTVAEDVDIFVSVP